MPSATSLSRVAEKKVNLEAGLPLAYSQSGREGDEYAVSCVFSSAYGF
jgi:hypothetical protein